MKLFLNFDASTSTWIDNGKNHLVWDPGAAQWTASIIDNQKGNKEINIRHITYRDNEQII